MRKNPILPSFTSIIPTFTIVAALLFFTLEGNAQSGDTLKPDLRINFTLVIDPNNGALQVTQSNDSTFQVASPGPSAEGYQLIANILQGGSRAIQSRIATSGDNIAAILQAEISEGAQLFTDQAKGQIAQEASIIRDSLERELNTFLYSANVQETLNWHRKKEISQFILYCIGSVFLLIASVVLLMYIKNNYKKK